MIYNEGGSETVGNLPPEQECKFTFLSNIDWRLRRRRRGRYLQADDGWMHLFAGGWNNRVLLSGFGDGFWGKFSGNSNKSISMVIDVMRFIVKVTEESIHSQRYNLVVEFFVDACKHNYNFG